MSRVPAIVLSVALHGGAALWLMSLSAPRAGDGADGREIKIEVEVVATPPPAPAGVKPAAGNPVDPVEGAADVFSRDPSSPWPGADVESPDRRAAARAAAGDPGSFTWTGRADRESWRAQGWNDPLEYRLGRHRTGDDRVSPESIPRAPAPRIDASHRDRRRRALEGARDDAAVAAGSWDELDPRYEGGADPGLGGAEVAAVSSTGSATKLGEDGAIVVGAGRPLVTTGEEATEAEVRGPTEDDVDAAQASNERQPGAFEMTKPRAGGPAAGEGTAGIDDGDGLSFHARRSGNGGGGTRADVPPGHGRPSQRARAQDAYMRKLYDKVLSRVRFPPRLAVELEQGEVMVTFTLHRDGSVTGVKIARSSGFREFDAALIEAIRDAAPFGPVPKTLSGDRASFPVKTPFTFDNPLIR